MKTHTSRKSVLIKSLLLIPLLALLLYGFSETKVETISAPASIENSNTINYLDKIEEVTLTVRITKKGELLIKGQEVSMAAAERYVKELLIRDRIIRAIILPDLEAPKQVIEDVNSMLEQYELAQINILGPEKSIREFSSHVGATKAQLATYNSLAKIYNKQPQASRVILKEDLRSLESVFRKMTEEQRIDAEPFPECAPIEDQEGATKKQISEYNALAQKYNAMLSKSKSIQIKMKDVERLEDLHGLMTHEQRENAAPFPDFPEPPPPPEAPKAPKTKKGEKRDIPPPPPPAPNIEQQELLIEKQEILIEQQEVKLEEQEIILEEQESRMEEREILMEEQEARTKEIDIDLNASVSVPSPPTPPTPETPLDHAIEMAKQGATFYFNKKKITSDEAIAILKKNEDLSMDIRKNNDEPPVVRIVTHL